MQGLDDRPRPPPPYLKVWISHCNIMVSRINSLIPRLTLEAKQLVSVWVFQIEFVYFYYYYYHYYYYFLFLARDQREPTTHVNKQAKQLMNAANTTSIVLCSGFFFLKEATIASTHFRHNCKFSYLFLWNKEIWPDYRGHIGSLNVNSRCSVKGQEISFKIKCVNGDGKFSSSYSKLSGGTWETRRVYQFRHTAT